jgi:antitoxin (DNA-binding transcriptional repressor) of toxin-antitoxin stability system
MRKLRVWVKQIGIRKFNENISKYLKELPLQLTNRRKLVATIVPIDQEKKKKTPPKIEAKNDISPPSGVEKPKVVYHGTWMCQEHKSFICACSPPK